MESKEAEGLVSICHKKPDEKTQEKKKWRNVRQMLSPAGRHFRKTDSNFDDVQAGPASCYKIKSIFWVSDQLKLVPLEIETLCKLIFI